MEITLEGLKEAAFATSAAAAVGGGLLWLFREKVRDWVRAQTQSQRAALEGRIRTLEQSHATHEGELMRIAETMERTSENMSESFRRLTTSLEKIVDKHEETSLAVARIEGIVEKRNHGRP